MKACDQASAANLAHSLPLRVSLAFGNPLSESNHVQIDGFVAAVATNLSIFAVTPSVVFF